MRVALIGQSAFGESVLNALIEQGDTVVGVFAPPIRGGRPDDPLESTASGHGIPVMQFSRMRDREAIDAMKSLDADLCVMAYVTDIVPEAILDAPTHGTIQYHPSLLPKHRGPSSINWPIILGKSRTGLTIFWPDKGLDAGPVLLQKEVDIDPDDTVGSLYFDKLFPLGVEAMMEAVDMVRDGTAPKVVQDESQATYEGWCKAEDIVIDWSQPVTEVYNLIRGGDPSPGAGSTLDGVKIRFYRARRRDQASGAPPGQVTDISEEGFGVACVGGTIFVRRVQPEGSPKISAAEWADSIGLRTCARFGGK